uniref:Uncharacterized protein n=1 Tax=Tanacetum cinerariifolium TaxID=118510 RepID=A0A6L2JS82_TANCI|nr:hypothetical protein [Tanacetum cinerariifolium]
MMYSELAFFMEACSVVIKASKSKISRTHVEMDRYGAHDPLLATYLSKHPRISPLMMCTFAILQIAYGAVPGTLDEYLHMGAITTRECLVFFCKVVMELYREEFLRKLTYNDLENLYGKHQMFHLSPSTSLIKGDVILLMGYIHSGLLMKSISNPYANDHKRIMCKTKHEEGDYSVVSDDYEGPPIFNDYQYEEEIVCGDVGKGFVDNYQNFQEEENNVSFSGVVLEEEPMPIYDTDIEDVIEVQEEFFRQGGFGGEEEDNIKDVVVANDLCSSMIQTTLSGDFSKTRGSNPHELIWLQKGNLVEVSILIGKKYQEEYLKDASIDDKFDFETIKVRGRVIIKKENLMQGIQIWMLQVQGTCEENARTSFFKWGRMMQLCLHHMSCFIVS